MSIKEAFENDKKTMEYTLNVISKMNRAMHDIYVVQKMQKKRINLTKILRFYEPYGYFFLYTGIFLPRCHFDDNHNLLKLRSTD